MMTRDIGRGILLPMGIAYFAVAVRINEKRSYFATRNWLALPVRSFVRSFPRTHRIAPTCNGFALTFFFLQPFAIVKCSG